MKWITREHPKVDRIACPWLIKRFVDPVPGAEPGHHRGDECSFDAIVRKYGLAKDNPALERLARIVRGADTDRPDLTPQPAGLLAIAQGFSEVFDDDQAQLHGELPVYDALYAWCQAQK